VDDDWRRYLKQLHQRWRRELYPHGLGGGLDDIGYGTASKARLGLINNSLETMKEVILHAFCRSTRPVQLQAGEVELVQLGKEWGEEEEEQGRDGREGQGRDGYKEQGSRDWGQVRRSEERTGL
jgi:hypothetical protein